MKGWRWWRLWFRSNLLPTFVAMVVSATLVSVVTNTILPGAELPDFYDPVFVPCVLAIATSVSLQGAIPHLEVRNPRLAIPRLSVVVIQTVLCLSAIPLMADPDSTFGIETAARSYLVSTGMMFAAAALFSPGVGRTLVVVRLLPALVLLPETDSPAAWLWWEFLPGDHIGSYVGSGLCWILGASIYSAKGARMPRRG